MHILSGMKRMPILCSVMLVVLLSSGCTTIVGDHPYQQDLHELYSTLPSAHKDFFQGRDRKPFQDFYEQAVAAAPAMDVGQLYYTLRKLASFAQDSHTSVGLTQELVQLFHAIPAQMAYLEGAWHLGVLRDSDLSLLGARVEAINGVPMQEVEELASALFGHDNEVWFRHSLAGQLNLTELYTYLGIAKGATDEVVLTVVPLHEREEQKLVLQPVKAGEYGNLSFVTLNRNLPETGPSRSYYRALLLDGDSVLFIQYNVCAENPEFPIADFVGAVSQLIQEKKIPKVIIDLRYNGGGDSRVFEPMIASLKQMQQREGLSIDVLIGENTFSSALMNAKQCKQRLDCRLVGTPTGGSVNHYGEVKHFTLPHTKLPVFYSTKYFVMDKSYTGTSLLPDLYLETRIEDLLAGRDTVVDTLLAGK